MRKQRLLLILMPLLSFFLFYCTDKISKNPENDGDVRVEYSSCTACYECMDLFSCPQNAIYIDEMRGTATIDPDKCVRCMRCITEFTCEYNAFTFKEDLIPPAPITDFSAVSDSMGTIDISFTATGDDSTSGIAWRYELNLKNASGEVLLPDFQPNAPKIAGLKETWHLSGLDSPQTVAVGVNVFDDCGLYASSQTLIVDISSDYPDVTAPSAITDLIAQPDADYVTLWWTAPGDDGDEGTAAAYDIRYSRTAIDSLSWDQASVFENTIAPTSQGVKETCRITLPDQANYYFAVRALDDSGNIASVSNNAQAAMTADVTPPDQITTLVAGNETTTSVTLTWEAVGDDGSIGVADDYVVKYHVLPITAQNWQAATTYDAEMSPQPAGETEELIIENLEEGFEYYFAVKAVDNAGNQSAISNVAHTQTVDIPDETAPSAIDDLVVSNTSTSTAQLRWTAPGGDGDEGYAFQYVVKASTQPITIDNWTAVDEIPNDLSPQVAGSQESFIVTGLEANTTYWFDVRAVDDALNIADLSNVAQGQTASEDDTVAPGAITDLLAHEDDPNILLTWTSTGDDVSEGTASYYEIRYSFETITGSNWAEATLLQNLPIPETAGTQQQYIFTSPQQNTAYYFAIKAFDDALNASELSNIAEGVIADDIAPSQIDDLQATAGTSDIELQWTAPGDDGDDGTAFSYEIRMSTVAITQANWDDAQLLENPPTPSTAGTAESYTVVAPQQDQTLFFAIRATDDADNVSAVSNNAESGIFDTTPPADITDLDATQSGEEALLTWTAPGDDGFTGTAESYEIRYATTIIDETNWASATLLSNAPYPESAGTQQQFSVAGLTADIQYYFGIKTLDDADNQSGLSNIADVTLGDDTVAPAAVTDLEVVESYVNLSTIRISWTAPGDDGITGTADHYEIRYSNLPITDANWSSASLFGSPPDPASAGTAQTLNVTGLDEGELYYFAIKAFDEIGNAGDCSNSPAGKIVYTISASQCRDCNHCINRCDQHAIYDAGPYKAIDPELCIACGECDPYCPYNAISPAVIAYND